MRKAISKKIRFEIFKRDSFKCQYCGVSAPDVILHVDHIHPVSKGGDNDISNLITSCFDCNMGKKDRALNDKAVIEKQKQQLDEINEKRVQLELMLKWRKELQSLDKTELSVAINEWNSIIENFQLNDLGESQLKKLILKHGLSLVLDSMNIAAKYLVKENGAHTQDSCSIAFSKIGAICTNKSLPEWKQQLSYIRGIARNRHSYHNPHLLMEKLTNAYEAGVDIETLKSIALTTRNWSQMVAAIADAINSIVGNE